MPSATISIYDHSDTAEGGSPGAVYLARSGDTSQEITVDYLVSGTADNGTDYSTLSGSITFGYYQVYKTIPIPPIDDSISEPTETVVVTLLIGTNYGIGSVGEATVNIFDNDVPVVSVAKVNEAVEGGTDGKFAVSRTGGLTNSLAVNFSMSGSALNGTDYVSVGGSVTIPAGQSSAPVLIDAIHDGLPDPDQTAVLTITSGSGYTIDPQNGSDSLILIEADPLPTAFDGWVTTSINEPIIVSVLDSATDLTPDPLTVAAVSQGTNGSVVLNGGSATYTPNTGFAGDDSFSYTVEDQFGNESTGTIEVTVTEPIAPPTSVWTALNTGVNIDVLEMAFDPDGDTLTTTAVTQGANGSVVINQNGSVTYTPNTSFTGDDSFTYTVEDPDENDATQMITVTVGPIDPVALDDRATTPINTAVDVEVLDLAFDPAGDTLELTGVTQGENGTVTINLDGSVTYTPDNNFEGTDTFTYTVEDEEDNPSTATIEVTVGPAVESEGDSVLDDLSIIEEAINENDESTLDTINSTLPTIQADVMGYTDEAMSYVSLNSIDSIGGGLPFNDFSLLPSLPGATLYQRLQILIGWEAQLYSVAEAHKQLVLTFSSALRTAKGEAIPDRNLILGLWATTESLTTAHRGIYRLWLVTYTVMNKYYLEYSTLWQATRREYPDLARYMKPPPDVPTRDYKMLIPK